MAAILQFWRGGLPLGEAFWLWGVLGGGVVNLFGTFAALLLLTEEVSPWLVALLMVAHIPFNLFLLLAMGGGVGFLSGLFGVGGGFLLTPLLIFYGVPAAVAVSTQANQVLATSIAGVSAHWRERQVVIEQHTAFPYADTTRLVVKGEGRFDVKVRVPKWATRGFVATINGRRDAAQSAPGTYLTLARLTEPFTEFFRYLPAPAFGALAVAVLGIYDGPKIAIIVIGTFFQQVLVIANTTRKLEATLVEAARTLGTRGLRPDQLWQIQFACTGRLRGRYRKRPSVRSRPCGRRGGRCRRHAHPFRKKPGTNHRTLGPTIWRTIRPWTTRRIRDVQDR